MSELDRLDRLQQIAEGRLPPVKEPEVISTLPNNFFVLPPGVKRNEFGKFYCENCLMVITAIHLQGDANPAIVPHTCSWTCGLCNKKFADKKNYTWHISRCAAFYDKYKLSGWI